MAKPRPVAGIEPKKGLRPNARRVLAVRIEEIYAYDGAIADPNRVTELHDMRIAFKRLRYLLEIFGVAFTEDLDPYLEQVKQLQDLLGDIHDCDVQVPMLEDHLEWLTAREAERAQALVAAGAARRPSRSANRSERAYQRFRGELQETLRGDERVGIHALIARRRHERDELYVRFLEEWRRLKRERFRPRLESALGL
jgi:hypothetical protein